MAIEIKGDTAALSEKVKQAIAQTIKNTQSNKESKSILV